LFDFQYDETRHWFGGHCTERTRHRTGVDKMNPIATAQFQFVCVTRNEHLHTEFNGFVLQCFFIAPRNDLVTVDQPNLQPGNLYHFFLSQILKTFVLEVALHDVEVTRKGFHPIVDLSATHITRADNCVDFVRSYHLAVLRWHFGCSMWNMKVAQKQYQNAHLLFVSHPLHCL
jgi:hypothetical protein